MFKEISIYECFFIHCIYSLNTDAAVSFLTPAANNHAPTHSLKVCDGKKEKTLVQTWPSVPAGIVTHQQLEYRCFCASKRLSLEAWFLGPMEVFQKVSSQGGVFPLADQLTG